MRGLRLGAAATIAAAAVAAAAPAQGAPTATKLIGTVGPGFTITLTMGGKAVKNLKRGAYTVVVTDKSGIHNFRLKGLGFNKATSIPKQGKTTWNLTLKTGTYRFVCDPHPDSMKGSFKVG